MEPPPTAISMPSAALRFSESATRSDSDICADDEDEDAGNADDDDDDDDEVKVA